MKHLFNMTTTAIAGIAFFLFLFSVGFPNKEGDQKRKFSASHATPGYEANLKKSGVVLNTAGRPNNHFVPAVTAGNLVFLSGHGPKQADGSSTKGKVGLDVTTEEGYQAARDTMISLLSSLKNEIGSLDRVKRIVKVHGMVNCTPTYTQQPAVINGATALLTEIFGDNGKPARAAVGMSSLPSNIPVEIEMIVELKP
ncbi:MAG: RidA family protein [Verrucomicrobia bacterium]|nr:RidA family protein [Verrucomicrobiota bacterium]